MKKYSIHLLFAVSLFLNSCGTTVAPLRPDYSLERTDKVVFMDKGLHDEIAIGIVSRDWDDLDENDKKTITAVVKNQLHEKVEIQIKVSYLNDDDAIAEKTEWMTFRLQPYKAERFTIAPKDQTVEDFVIDARYIR